jgi:hypothetical protein
LNISLDLFVRFFSKFCFSVSCTCEKEVEGENLVEVLWRNFSSMFAELALLEFTLFAKIKPLKVFEHLVKRFSSFFIERSQRINDLFFGIDSKQRFTTLSALFFLNNISLAGIFFLISQTSEEKIVSHSNLSSLFIFSLLFFLLFLNSLVNILKQFLLVVQNVHSIRHLSVLVFSFPHHF